MAKNRKYQSAAVRFGPALKAFLLCGLIGGSGVGYVWQKSQIDELGRQIKAHEVRLAELQTTNKKMRDHLSVLRSPIMLKQRIEELKLGLVEPQQSQIWRLPEPLASPSSSPEADLSRQFAGVAAAR
jgi:hypothetical protein